EQPAPEGLALPDGAGLAHQDEEGSLKGVLRVLFVVQDTTADRQDGRAVPPHQLREGRLILGAGEAVEQLAVGQAGRVPVGPTADEAGGGAQAGSRHESSPGPRVASSPVY